MRRRSDLAMLERISTLIGEMFVNDVASPLLDIGHIGIIALLGLAFALGGGSGRLGILVEIIVVFGVIVQSFVRLASVGSIIVEVEVVV